MPRSKKSKYTDKQERKADHIAKSSEDRGVSEKEAERRVWATVNEDDGGSKKRPADPDAAKTPGIRLLIKMARRVARLLHHDLLPIARPRRRRQPLRARDMPSIALTKTSCVSANAVEQARA